MYIWGIYGSPWPQPVTQPDPWRSHLSPAASVQWSGEKKFRSGPGRDQRLISGTVPGPGPGLFYCFIVHLTNAV